MNAAFNLAALPPTTTAAFTPGFPLGANVVWAGPIQMGLEEHGTRAVPNNHDKGSFPQTKGLGVALSWLYVYCAVVHNMVQW